MKPPSGSTDDEMKTDETVEHERIFERQKITPPPAAKIPSALRKARADGFDIDILNDQDKVKLIFLYSRDIGSAIRNREERVERMSFFLNPENSGDKKFQRFERLLRTTGDKTFQDCPTKWQKYPFEEGDILFDWMNKRASFTVFFHHNLNVMQRRQLDGNCPLHAVIVLHAYLVQMGTKQDHGMLDLSKLVRRGFNDKQLGKYILENAGGSAIAVATQVLTGDGRNENFFFRLKHIPEIRELLKQFGPALVTNFAVDESFRTSDCLSFAGEPNTGQFESTRHSMLLVGFRQEFDGGSHCCTIGLCGNRRPSATWFLLQNWWRKKQFVQVSAEYLEACEAKLTFFKEKQTRSLYPSVSTHFAEATIDDGYEEQEDDDGSNGSFEEGVGTALFSSVTWCSTSIVSMTSSF